MRPCFPFWESVWDRRPSLNSSFTAARICQSCPTVTAPLHPLNSLARADSLTPSRRCSFCPASQLPCGSALEFTVVLTGMCFMTVNTKCPLCLSLLAVDRICRNVYPSPVSICETSLTFVIGCASPSRSVCGPALVRWDWEIFSPTL